MATAAQRAGRVDKRAGSLEKARLRGEILAVPVAHLPEVGKRTRRSDDAEFVLNADDGGGGFTRDGKPLGFGLQTLEKTYQSYYLRVRNPGGHSSRPRPDGTPVYGVDGSCGEAPDDERAHGKDERLPVQSRWDNVLHWKRIVRELAT